MDNTDNSVLLTKLSSLPNDLKAEVIDFIDFLLTKKEKVAVKKRGPKFGSAKGMFILKPGWDDPLEEEFKDYM